MSSSIILESVRLAGGKGLELKNRVIMAPLTRGRAGNNEVMGNKHQIEYYTQRASAGLIITEATAVSEQGKGWGGAGTIYKPEHAVGWKKVTDAVHQKDGKIFLQLWHMGRVS
jgi:N-ethylmaleimide reductase